MTAILAVLATVIITMVVGHVSESKKDVCISNRNTIIRTYYVEYCSHYYDDENFTLQNVLIDKYKDFPIDMSKCGCPFGGRYRISVDGKSIVCSICGSGEEIDGINTDINGTDNNG